MYTARDFEHGCPPRIMGSEAELTVADRGNHLLEIIQSGVGRGGFHADEGLLLLDDGGILYDDGQLLESSTPECIGGTQVTLYERAGERIAQSLVDHASDKQVSSHKVYKRSGYYDVRNKNGELLLWKTHVGNHENYYQPDDITILPYGLEDYLATRPIWSGSGIVGPDYYICHQRAPRFDDENYAFPGLTYADDRLEYKDSDGNLSDWTVKTKFNMTSLVLRLCEGNYYPTDYTLWLDPEAVTRSLTHNFGECVGVTEAGKIVSATELQRMIARLALDVFGDHPDIPREELQAAEDVLKVCNDIDAFLADPEALPLISDRVEWAAKLAWMHEAGLKNTDLTTSCLYAVQKDIQWGDISATGPATNWFRQHGTPNSVFSVRPKQIKTAMKRPPETRAKLRTEIAKNILSSGDFLGNFSWSFIDDEWLDPYSTKS